MAKKPAAKSSRITETKPSIDPDILGPFPRPYPGMLPRETARKIRAAVKAVIRQRATTPQT